MLLIQQAMRCVAAPYPKREGGDVVGHLEPTKAAEGDPDGKVRWWVARSDKVGEEAIPHDGAPSREDDLVVDGDVGELDEMDRKPEAKVGAHQREQITAQLT